MTDSWPPNTRSQVKDWPKPFVKHPPRNSLVPRKSILIVSFCQIINKTSFRQEFNVTKAVKKFAKVYLHSSQGVQSPFYLTFLLTTNFELLILWGSRFPSQITFKIVQNCNLTEHWFLFTIEKEFPVFDMSLVKFFQIYCNVQRNPMFPFRLWPTCL